MDGAAHCIAHRTASSHSVNAALVWIQYVNDREIGAVFDRLCAAKNVKCLFPDFEFMEGRMY